MPVSAIASNQNPAPIDPASSTLKFTKKCFFQPIYATGLLMKNGKTRTDKRLLAASALISGSSLPLLAGLALAGLKIAGQFSASLGPIPLFGVCLIAAAFFLIVGMGMVYTRCTEFRDNDKKIDAENQRIMAENALLCEHSPRNLTPRTATSSLDSRSLDGRSTVSPKSAPSSPPPT